MLCVHSSVFHAMPVKLPRLSLRDLFFVALPGLLLVALAFWAAAQFIKPAPPHSVVISSGGESDAYQRFALQYKEFLQRYDIEVVIRPSAGSMANLARLRDPGSGVMAAFVQGGTARVETEDRIESLGDFYYEPLWVFYRAESADFAPLDRIVQLKGMRIAIGIDGSGTQHLAREVLSASGVDETNTRLIKEGGMDLPERLRQGRLDAVLAVGPTQSSLVWSLLYTPGVRLMNLVHADAYSRRLAHLDRLVLPRGAIDLVRDIPPRDVNLLSPVTTLMVRRDIHPALADLLMQAATEVHGGPGVFQRPGEFPRVGHREFPLSDEAERYYKSGKPFLQKYLPFWAATLADRLMVMLLPLVAVLFPLVRFAPSIYGWRVRSRIYRRYGELKFLEAELDESPQRHSRADWLAKLDVIAADVNRMPTPLAFADMLYTLRAHIELVRASVARAALER